jgi:hypothetical protein
MIRMMFAHFILSELKCRLLAAAAAGLLGNLV